MKKGRSLQDLATEVERQQGAKKDYIVDTGVLRAEVLSPGVITVGAMKDVKLPRTTVQPLAHSQIASRLSIPKQYYDRLQINHPQLLVNTLNYLFLHQSEKRMLRTMDGNLRAFLSNRYQRIDNYMLLLHAILPVLLEEMKADVHVESCEITEHRMYLKVVHKGYRERLRSRSGNDEAMPGFVISNSEVGLGSVQISEMLYRLACKNGMIGESLMKKYHVGRNVDKVNSEVMFSEETLRADDRAIIHKVQDMVRHAVNEERFKITCAKMSKTEHIEVSNPQLSVQALGDQFQLRETEKSAILERFFKNSERDGDTYFNLVNAVTQSAESVHDYERATELERLGGKLIDLPISQVSSITSLVP